MHFLKYLCKVHGSQINKPSNYVSIVFVYVAELLEPLDYYIQNHWAVGLVKIIRLPVRSGLIRTRLAGIQAAKGEVFVVMDGHMEVSSGW